MKTNEITRKKLLVGTLSLALMTAFLPQMAFADAATQPNPITPAVIQTICVKATPVTATAKAINFDQVSFKDFIKDMNLKSNTPASTLTQAEKHFNAFKMANKAKQHQKATASFTKMMQLLSKYQDVKEISATVIADVAPATTITVTTPATPIQ